MLILHLDFLVRENFIVKYKINTKELIIYLYGLKNGKANICLRSVLCFSLHILFFLLNFTSWKSLYVKNRALIDSF